MKRTTAIGLLVAGLSLALLCGADKVNCVPGEPDEPVCAVPADCEGLPHVMCVGQWGCVLGECTWSCGTTPPPEEICGDGLDNDKDGEVDEGCEVPPDCDQDSDCPAGQVCEIYCGNGWCNGVCKPGTTPECFASGCSGQVCSTESVITTCEWQEWYGCLKYSECGPYGPDGTCGWKETPEYLECLQGLWE